jgi:small subunit ribosomal protein S17
MERNKRKVYRGVVVSDKMDKTITVAVDRYQKDRLYSKRIKRTKKFYVHDEANEAGIGDTVAIMETRPLSKNKRFRLLRIIEKSTLV